MATDIVIQLRELAASMKRGEGMSTVYGAANEIERLREQIKALVHEWELSERGVHCEHKDVCDEI